MADSLKPPSGAVDYVLRYGGRCRDCADEDGICPANGLPCSTAAARKAIGHTLDALNYGIEHGYITLADALSAQPAPQPSGEDDFPGLHRATVALVMQFSGALASKLRRAEEKYGYTDGWSRNDWQGECRRQLAEHVQKGDPLDVAAYAAFCWKHGWSTATPLPPAHPPRGQGRYTGPPVVNRPAQDDATPAPQPSAERLERLASRLEEEHGKWVAEADYWLQHGTDLSHYRERAAEALANAAAIRSAISSQTSPQGKQGVRTELARLGSQEATPNTGVKLEGGGG